MALFADIVAQRRPLLLACALALSALFTTGCADKTKTATLHSIGSTDRTTLVIKYAEGGPQVTMPNGELLKGDYTLGLGHGKGTGEIFSAVYGKESDSKGSVWFGGISGTVSMTGNRGTTMECEFVNKPMESNGFGACQTNVGALYRMEY